MRARIEYDSSKVETEIEAILKMSQVRSSQSAQKSHSNSNTNALEDTAKQNDDVPPHQVLST